MRIDSAARPDEGAKNPAENTKRIADTFRQASTIAEDYGERLAAEGEICWGEDAQLEAGWLNCLNW